MRTRLQLSPMAGNDERDGPLPLAVLEFGSPSAAVIATPVPPLARATNFLVFLLVASLLTACGLISIDKIVTAKGKLVAAVPNIIIKPFDQAIIESIDVQKGDIVRKGQVLAHLNPTFSTADFRTLQDQVDLLSATEGRLRAIGDGTEYQPEKANPHARLQVSLLEQQRNEYKFSLRNFEEKVDELKTQIAGSEVQSKYYRQRIDLATKIEDIRQKLQKLELGSPLNTMLAKDVRLTMEGLLSQAESDAAQASRKLAGAQAERETFIQHWNSQISKELSETRRNLVQAQQDYSKANLRKELVVLNAPRDAVVLSIAKVSAGSVVTGAEPMIQLVPLDTELSVEADISGIDSGYIRSDNEVKVKFDTLPFLQYGSAVGRVRSISGDSFSPEIGAQEASSALPSRPTTLYYKGDISIEKLMLHDTPLGFRLMPGMPITADVKVGTRSILAYFVEKILPVAADSMREP